MPVQLRFVLIVLAGACVGLAATVAGWVVLRLRRGELERRLGQERAREVVRDVFRRTTIALWVVVMTAAIVTAFVLLRHSDRGGSPNYLVARPGPGAT